MTIVCDCCGGIAYVGDEQNFDQEPTHQCQKCREANHDEKYDGRCQDDREAVDRSLQINTDED